MQGNIHYTYANIPQYHCMASSQLHMPLTLLSTFPLLVQLQCSNDAFPFAHLPLPLCSDPFSDALSHMTLFTHSFYPIWFLKTKYLLDLKCVIFHWCMFLNTTIRTIILHIYIRYPFITLKAIHL
jgi:hypothetical protein